MNCLLHCIFKPDGREAPAGRPAELLVIEGHGLAAAVSPWPEPAPEVEMTRLLAHERAIAWFHASRTVIPIRFGCVVEESAVLDRIRERRVEYEELLGRLEGRSEMGLRLWWAPPPEEPQPAREGARYLAAVRGRHAGLRPDERTWAARIACELKGLYAGQRNEARPADNGRLVSLYFLVPRDSVEDFRGRARQMKTVVPLDMKVLVSGPWPPYNFATLAQP